MDVHAMFSITGLVIGRHVALTLPLLLLGNALWSVW